MSQVNGKVVVQKQQSEKTGAVKTARTLPPPPPLAALASVQKPLALSLPVLRTVPPTEIPAGPLGLDAVARAKKQHTGSVMLQVLGAGLGVGCCIGFGYMLALAERPAPASSSLAQPIAIEAASDTRHTLSQQSTHAASVARDPALTEVLSIAHEIAARPADLQPTAAKSKTKLQPSAAASGGAARARKPARVAAAPAEPESTAAQADEADDAELPSQPSRDAVQAGLENLRPALLACAEGSHAVGYASVTIASTGKVSYSVIEGPFAGTKTGSCMARALRSATFPRFEGASFKVHYPFAL
jgi:hypothetical protein